MNKEIKLYRDITEDDCTTYSGKQLKHFYDVSNFASHIKFESIKNGKREKDLYNPHKDFDDERLYKCYEYSRVSGAGIEYNTIAILDF